jgi:hypothetical protein
VSSYQLDSLERLANPSIAGGGSGATGPITASVSSGRYGRRLWDAARMSDADAQLERVDYNDLVNSTTSRTATPESMAAVPGEETEKSRTALKALLGNLLRHGFAFVDNVPTDLESTMAAATTICPPLVRVVRFVCMTFLGLLMGGRSSSCVRIRCELSPYPASS